MTESKGDILKVRLGDDTRRIVLYNTHISYDDLVLMLQRVYNGGLKSTDEVTLKYYDEDNDLITIVDATDFSHAREYSKNGIVKMIVFVNGQDIKSALNATQIHDLRKELTEVRDKVNSLVDTLDMGQLNVGSSEGQPYTHTTPPVNTVTLTTKHIEEPPKPIATAAASLFDPLKPTSDEFSVITTSATTQIPLAMASNLVQSTSQAPPTTGGSGHTAHLFTGGQSGGQFLDQMQPPQTAQPTAPPPSSTPQPPPSQSGAYSGYPPNPPTGQASQTGYAGGPYQTPYPSQPTAPQTGPPHPQTSQYQSGHSTAPYQQPQQHPPTSTISPYGGNPGAYQQPHGPGGQTYPPPQGQAPPVRGGYPPYSRPSPYRVGY